MREEIQRIRIVFQSPLIPLFGLYPSSSTFPKRERKRKVYLLGRRAYYHVYCKSFVTLQSPKAPRSLSRKAGGELRACPVPIAIGNGRAASPKVSPSGIRGQFLYAQCGLKPQCAIRCIHQKSPLRGDLEGLHPQKAPPEFIPQGGRGVVGAV